MSMDDKKLENLILQPPATDANPEKKRETRKDSALLDNQGNGDLAENLQIFETPEWVRVYAATDRGFSKKENHDRIVIAPEVSRFTVLDGMASAGASQVLAENILAFPDDPKKALRIAKFFLPAREGTCIISAKLTPQKTLQVYQSGDCGAMVFGPKGEVKFSATYGVKTRTDVLEVEDMKKFGIKRTSQKLVDTLPASYIAGSFGEFHEYGEIRLEDGDTVLLFSDVVWCNFSERELSQLVAESKNPRDLFKTIAQHLKQKMQSVDRSSKLHDFASIVEKVRCYYGGDHVPNPDNQSLVLFKV